MTKRKLSSTKDAAIYLLSEGLGAIDDNLLASIEETLQQERRKRSSLSVRLAIQGDGQFSTSAIETSLLSSPESPTSGVVDKPLEISASIKRLLYQLLFARPEIEAFFEAGTEKVLSGVLARADARIEILRKTNIAQQFILSEKFERLLTDRSLALSHEQYDNGNAKVNAFAASLKLTKVEDKKLAVSAIYRGKMWRTLEESVGEPGISAVMCCEHTLFKKGVRSKEIGKLAQCLKLTCFAPILGLAKKVRDTLEESQRAFDKSIGVNTQRLTEAIGTFLTL